MFVNLKTNKPAWLIAHDVDVIYSLGAPDDKAHPHQNVTSYEFFAGHREATAEELADYGGGVPWLARLREPGPRTVPKKPKAPRAAKTPKPRPARKTPAKASTAAREGRKDAQASKPPASGASAAPPANPTASGAADGAAAAPAAKPAGGEPHGE